MLTIENLNKIQNRNVAGDWVVKECGTHLHNECYYFGLYNIQPFGVTDICRIMLERTHILDNEGTKCYYFICNSQRTNVCGSADWLSDIDNMIGQLEYLVKGYHKKL